MINSKKKPQITVKPLELLEVIKWTIVSRFSLLPPHGVLQLYSYQETDVLWQIGQTILICFLCFLV